MSKIEQEFSIMVRNSIDMPYLVVALCTVVHNGFFAAFFLQSAAMKVFLVAGRAVFFAEFL